MTLLSRHCIHISLLLCIHRYYLNGGDAFRLRLMVDVEEEKATGLETSNEKGDSDAEAISEKVATISVK